MTKCSTYKLGKESEKIALIYLEKNNFSILKQNWRAGRTGEIDIVTRDKSTNELVFTEVKSCASSLDDAKELVTPQKQKQLVKLAKLYLYLTNSMDLPCRFDVIAIKINNDKKILEHIRNAF